MSEVGPRVSDLGCTLSSNRRMDLGADQEPFSPRTQIVMIELNLLMDALDSLMGAARVPA